jgi:pyrimidine oxygenase
MTDCVLSPRPDGKVPIVAAGQSGAGVAFAAKYADYNFCLGTGVNTPTAFAPSIARLVEEAARTGRDVGSYVLFMVIADETDAAAMAKWEHYKAGKDSQALGWLDQQANNDAAADANSTAKAMTNPVSMVNFNMGTLVGSYESVARMMDEMEGIPGLKGVMLTFDDFVEGIEAFGTRIQPLMKSRTHAMNPA